MDTGERGLLEAPTANGHYYVGKAIPMLSEDHGEYFKGRGDSVQFGVDLELSEYTHVAMDYADPQDPSSRLYMMVEGELFGNADSLQGRGYHYSPH